MTKWSMRGVSPNRFYSPSATHCNTLQHTATHYNTLQHTATHCNTLQHTATHCSTLQHTAIYAVHSYLVCRSTVSLCVYCASIPLQHTATHCKAHCKAHCNSLKGRQCNVSRSFLNIYLCLSASTVRAVLRAVSSDMPTGNCDCHSTYTAQVLVLSPSLSDRRCVAVCCSVVQCTAVCCSVMQHIVYVCLIRMYIIMYMACVRKHTYVLSMCTIRMPYTMG